MPASQPTPFAGADLLAGANVIYNFLVSVGMPEGTDVYHLRRTGRWPIENTAGDGCGGGGILVASRYRLLKCIEKLTRGPRRPAGRRPTKPRRARRTTVAAPPIRQASKPAAPPKRRRRTNQPELRP